MPSDVRVEIRLRVLHLFLWYIITFRFVLKCSILMVVRFSFDCSASVSMRSQFEITVRSQSEVVV